MRSLFRRAIALVGSATLLGNSALLIAGRPSLPQHVELPIFAGSLLISAYQVLKHDRTKSFESGRAQGRAEAEARRVAQVPLVDVSFMDGNEYSWELDRTEDEKPDAVLVLHLRIENQGPGDTELVDVTGEVEASESPIEWDVADAVCTQRGSAAAILFPHPLPQGDVLQCDLRIPVVAPAYSAARLAKELGRASSGRLRASSGAILPAEGHVSKASELVATLPLVDKYREHWREIGKPRLVELCSPTVSGKGSAG